MGLALVVIEEHAGRAVHLRDDDALGAVDDEGALLRHERDVAHVDILFLDVLHGTGAGLLVSFEHDEAQLDLQRRGIGHVALNAFLDVVLGLLELVGDVFEHGALVEILDRENGLEDRLDALVPTVSRARFALEELFVGGALNLDQVRHLHGFRDAAERLADPLLTGEGLRHLCPLRRRTIESSRRSSVSCVHPRTRMCGPDAGSPYCRQGRPFAWSEGGGPCLGTIDARKTESPERAHAARESGDFAKGSR